MADNAEELKLRLSIEDELFKRKVKESARSIQNLEARFDPLIKAERDLQVAQERLSRALQKGTITQDRYNALMLKAQGHYDRTSAKLTQMATAANQNAGTFRVNSGIMQQAGYQIGDFAVQVQGGTSALTAFSQQGSQLLGVFGAYGAVAGAVLAISAPLIGALMRGGEAAKDQEESAKALSEAMSAVADAHQIAMAPLQDLRKEYGDNAEAVRDLNRELVALATQQALMAVDDAIRAGGEQLDPLLAQLQDYAEKRRELLAAQDAPDANFLPSEMRAFEEAAQESLRALQDEFGFTSAQAYRLKDALDDIATAGTTEEAARAAAALASAISEAAAEGAEIPPEVAKVAREAAGAFAEFSRVRQSAEDVQSAVEGAAAAGQTFAEVDFAGNLSVAAASAEELLASVQDLAKITSARRAGDSYLDNYGTVLAYQAYGQSRSEAPDAPVKHKPKRSSRGGGASQGQKDHNAALSEAKRIIDQTKTAAEKYGEQLSRLRDLHEKGYISGETYARAVDLIGDQYRDAASAADEFAGINAMLKDSILDFAENGESAMDSLAASIKRAALEALLFGEGPLAGVFGSMFGDSAGGAVGAIIGGIFGGARANGGPVDGGKTYLVGERGPELFTPSVTGAITPNHKLGGSVAVNYAPTIDARGADPSVVARLEQQNRVLMGNFKALTVQAVNEARRRGELK